MDHDCRTQSRKTVSPPKTLLKKNNKSDRDDKRLENISDGVRSETNLYLLGSYVCTPVVYPLICFL